MLKVRDEMFNALYKMMPNILAKENDASVYINCENFSRNDDCNKFREEM